MRSLTIGLTLLFLIMGTVQVRAQQVDAHLLTGFDVSGSMTNEQLQVQIRGMATALTSPLVMNAIRSGKNKKILFSVFVWAESQRIIVADRVIQDEIDATAVALEINNLLGSSPKDGLGSLTDISNAMKFADRFFYTSYLTSGYSAKKRILNIVGDGEDNAGDATTDIRQQLIAKKVTINAVAINANPATLHYFMNSVRGGKTGFVINVLREEDMVGAMISKFVIEIAYANSSANG